MIHDGKEYIPDNQGYYRCPNACGHPDFPKPKWKTEIGFAKHLAKCPNRPLAPEESPKPPEPEWFADCPDCGEIIWTMETVWRMADKIVCIACYGSYYKQGMGHMDAAGLELPGVALFG